MAGPAANRARAQALTASLEKQALVCCRSRWQGLSGQPEFGAAAFPPKSSRQMGGMVSSSCARAGRDRVPQAGQHAASDQSREGRTKGEYQFLLFDTQFDQKTVKENVVFVVKSPMGRGATGYFIR